MDEPRPGDTAAQLAILPAREELERLFALSLDLLCVAGFDGYFKLLNPAWERMLGFTIDELLARPYLDFVHPDDRAATLAEGGKLRAGSHVISFENRYRCNDGSYKWLLWNATPSSEEQFIYASAARHHGSQEGTSTARRGPRGDARAGRISNPAGGRPPDSSGHW